MNEAMRWLLFLPRQASTVARMVDTLHYVVISATIGGAFLVTVIGGVLLIRYRRRPTSEPPRTEAFASPPLWFEISAIITLFFLFVGFWAVGVRQYGTLRVPPEDAMPVYVTAKQWMWTFAYPDGARSMTTLYVPVGRPVKVILTSRDVIHSFFVPEFRIKQDAVPGRYTTAWFEVTRPGRYEIFCTEYCGLNHSTMRGEVVALEPADWARWASGAPASATPSPPVYVAPSVAGDADPREPLNLVRQGEIAAARHGCLRCHTLDGSPHLGPTWAGLFGARVPLEGGTSVTADERYITESMMDPLAKMHAGYRALMPSYQGSIEPAETAAIIELIRSIRDVPLVSAPAGGVVVTVPNAPLPSPTARP